MILIVEHRVRDFDAWKSAFDEHGTVRRKYSATGHIIYRVLDDPGNVIVVNEFQSAKQAEAFTADPSLKEAMDRGGVVGEPRIVWAEEIDRVQY